MNKAISRKTSFGYRFVIVHRMPAPFARAIKEGFWVVLRRASGVLMERLTKGEKKTILSLLDCVMRNSLETKYGR